METREIVTRSEKETKKAAANLVDRILTDLSASEKAVVICLRGDLGSGKTTFTQGVAQALDVKDTVNSPTFLIMKKYMLLGKYRGKELYHFDLYRIRESQELLDLGWKEIIDSKDNIVVVEWPEKAEEILPKERIEAEFEPISTNERRITFHF